MILMAVISKISTSLQMILCIMTVIISSDKTDSSVEMESFPEEVYSIASEEPIYQTQEF